MKNTIKNNRGITLIALVVTIIVMLILAGITLKFIWGEGGIIQKAERARIQHVIGEEKDILSLSHSTLYIDNKAFGDDYKTDNMHDEIQKHGKNNVTDWKTPEKIMRVRFEDSKNVYTIDIETGEIKLEGTYDPTIEYPELQYSDLEFIHNPSDWTNGNTTVTIQKNPDLDINLDELTIQYSIGNLDNWINYTEPFEMTQNGMIYVRLVYELIGEKSDYISNEETKIDKLPPNDFIPATTSTTNKIKVIATATDAEATAENGKSDIKEYRFSKDGGNNWTEWQESGTYEFTKLTQETTYNIKVEVKDNAGNVTSVSTSSTTRTVTTPTSSDLSYTTNWTGTNGTVNFTTTTEFIIEVSTDGTNWETKDAITVPSGTQIYVRYSDGTNTGGKYAAVKPLWTGTVTYNANNGTGSVPSTQSVQHTMPTTVSFSPVPTRTGYTFQGWATSSSATSATYTSSGTKTFTMGTSNVTLYAVWKINAYTVTYNANTGTGSVPSTQTQNYNTTVTVSFSPVPTKSNSVFLGWTTSSTATTPTYTSTGTRTFTMGTSNVTLYAVWHTHTGNASSGGGCYSRVVTCTNQRTSAVVCGLQATDRVATCSTCGLTKTTSASRHYQGTCDGTETQTISDVREPGDGFVYYTVHVRCSTCGKSYDNPSCINSDAWWQTKTFYPSTYRCGAAVDYCGEFTTKGYQCSVGHLNTTSGACTNVSGYRCSIHSSSVGSYGSTCGVILSYQLNCGY